MSVTYVQQKSSRDTCVYVADVFDDILCNLSGCKL